MALTPSMPETGRSHGRKWLGAILVSLVLSIYTVYFVGRYAAFSLLIDDESIAIEELVRKRLSVSLAADHDLHAPVVGPNRAIGCSFLLLEELWRDCKAIRIPDLGRSMSPGERSLVQETVAAPCRWIAVLEDGPRASVSSGLKCSSSKSRRFIATLFVMRNGNRTILETIEGRIGE